MIRGSSPLLNGMWGRRIRKEKQGGIFLDLCERVIIVAMRRERKLPLDNLRRTHQQRSWQERKQAKEQGMEGGCSARTRISHWINSSNSPLLPLINVGIGILISTALAASPWCEQISEALAPWPLCHRCRILSLLSQRSAQSLQVLRPLPNNNLA